MGADVADSLLRFGASCYRRAHQVEGEAVDNLEKIAYRTGCQRATSRGAHHTDSYQDFAECCAAGGFHQAAVKEKYGAVQRYRNQQRGGGKLYFTRFDN